MERWPLGSCAKTENEYWVPSAIESASRWGRDVIPLDPNVANRRGASRCDLRAGGEFIPRRLFFQQELFRDGE